MKRLFDLSLVIMASPIWVPVLLLVALWVRFRLGSPVFFTQERPGLHAKSFELIKFRTMTDQRDEAGKLLSDTERLTPFGQWLRSTSLDELPELWNVLRGEMSLVGPRPLLKQYVPLIQSTNPDVMMSCQESPVGHRSTVVMPFHGKKNSIWMCIMSIITP